MIRILINLLILAATAILVYPTAVFIIGWFGLKLAPVVFVLFLTGLTVLALKAIYHAAEEWYISKQNQELRKEQEGAKL